MGLKSSHRLESVSFTCYLDYSCYSSPTIFSLAIADPETLRGLLALKGALEIGISGALIYALVARSQRELREANALLEGVLNASPLAIVAANREGTTTVWSDGAEEMYGWSEEDALGESAPNVPDEDWGDFEYLREQMFEEGESVIGYETTRQTKDGSRIDVSITTGAMRNETGDFIGIIAVQEDITDKKARERELERPCGTPPCAGKCRLFARTRRDQSSSLSSPSRRSTGISSRRSSFTSVQSTNDGRDRS